MMSSNACTMNCGSLSEIMDSGKLNYLNKLLCNNFPMIVQSEVFVVGMRITPFIRLWSTTDRIQSQLTPSTVLDMGRLVIKSMEQSANGCEDCDPAMGINAGFDGEWLILSNWHFDAFRATNRLVRLH